MLAETWVNRIFERLKCFYRDNWVERYERSEDIKKINVLQWQCGLSGLTADEIKTALMMSERGSRHNVPTVIEFYHYAKGKKVSKIEKDIPPKVRNEELANRHLSNMRQILR